MKNQINQNMKRKRTKIKRSKKHQEMKKDMAGIIQLDGLQRHQRKIQRLKPRLRQKKQNSKGRQKQKRLSSKQKLKLRKQSSKQRLKLRRKLSKTTQRKVMAGTTLLAGLQQLPKSQKQIKKNNQRNKNHY